MVDEKEHTFKEHFITEGFTLEWSRRGLLIRAIEYHPTELLIDWNRLTNMSEFATGDSLKERTEGNSVIDVRETTLESIRHLGKPEDSLKESKIIRALAEEACQRITRKTIARLQRMTDALLSGDHSGLRNAWDAICVEVQLGRSNLWDAYDRSVRSFMTDSVSELQRFEREAIWLQTIEGQRWGCDPQDDRNPDPVDDDDIINYIANYFVYWEAYCWSNPRIRGYIERHNQG